MFDFGYWINLLPSFLCLHFFNRLFVIEAIKNKLDYFDFNLMDQNGRVYFRPLIYFVVRTGESVLIILSILVDWGILVVKWERKWGEI